MKTVPLRRLASMTYGEALAADRREAGSVPVMSSGGVSGQHTTANTLKPAIVVGRKGSHGTVWWTDERAFVIDTAYFIDSRNTDADLRWLFYALLTLNLPATSSDVGVPGLSRERAYELHVPMTSLGEQRRIADFLDDRVTRIDQIIAARQQQQCLLEEGFQSERSLTIRGLHDSTKCDPAPGWIGQMKSGWRARRIGQLARFYTGAGFPPDQQGAEYGDLPLLKVSDLAAADDRRRVGSATNWISHEQAAALGAHVAPPDTLLLPKVGAALLTNSRAVTTREVTFDNNVMGIRFCDGDVRYWFHVLSGIDMGAVTNPGPVPSINKATVASLSVPVPQTEIQTAIGQRLDRKLVQVHSRTRALHTVQARLQEYKQSLITAAVTGEFDVTTASPRIPE